MGNSSVSFGQLDDWTRNHDDANVRKALKKDVRRRLEERYAPIQRRIVKDDTPSTLTDRTAPMGDDERAQTGEVRKLVDEMLAGDQQGKNYELGGLVYRACTYTNTGWTNTATFSLRKKGGGDEKIDATGGGANQSVQVVVCVTWECK